MLLTSPKHEFWAALTALAAGTVAWQSTVLMAGLLTVWNGMDLFAEWRVQRTLVALARTAPVGLVIVGRDASWAQGIRLVWGADSDQRRWQSRT
jgi:hypothetical protein